MNKFIVKWLIHPTLYGWLSFFVLLLGIGGTDFLGYNPTEYRGLAVVGLFLGSILGAIAIYHLLTEIAVRMIIGSRYCNLQLGEKSYSPNGYELNVVFGMRRSLYYEKTNKYPDNFAGYRASSVDIGGNSDVAEGGYQMELPLLRVPCAILWFWKNPTFWSRFTIEQGNFNFAREKSRLDTSDAEDGYGT